MTAAWGLALFVAYMYPSRNCCVEEVVEKSRKATPPEKSRQKYIMYLTEIKYRPPDAKNPLELFKQFKNTKRYTHDESLFFERSANTESTHTKQHTDNIGQAAITGNCAKGLSQAQGTVIIAPQRNARSQLGGGKSWLRTDGREHKRTRPNCLPTEAPKPPCDSLSHKICVPSLALLPAALRAPRSQCTR